ncbi:MAG: vitamin K epoxide reductase [Saprospiraceae bacterium]
MNTSAITEPFDTNTKRRNWVVGISTVGAIAGHLVTMYQQNILKQSKPSVVSAFADKLEDVTANKVQIPDAAVNIINYALTAWLAKAGSKNRAKHHPILPIAMGVKTIADSVVALEMAREDWEENKKIGTYPQLAAFASISAAAVAVPEMVNGIRHLVNGESYAAKI